MLGSIEVTWILNVLLQSICCHCGWNNTKNIWIWPHTSMSLEKAGVVIAFSDSCGFSSLILHQNSASCNFLKVSYSAESEPISINSLYSVPFKSIGLICTWNGSSTYAYFCNIMHWSFGKYWFTELRMSSSVDTFHCIIPKYVY